MNNLPFNITKDKIQDVFGKVIKKQIIYRFKIFLVWTNTGRPYNSGF